MHVEHYVAHLNSGVLHFNFGGEAMKLKGEKSCCSMNHSFHSELSPKEMNTLSASCKKVKNVKDESDMVYISGGEFLMGSEDSDAIKADGEGPIRSVSVSPFWMDRFAVTNKQFQEFVEDTNYVTDAEKYGWSFVF